MCNLAAINFVDRSMLVINHLVKGFLIVGFFFMGIITQLSGQNKVSSAAFSDKINSYLDFSIPVVSVKEAHQLKDVVFLDAREIDEYEVSHLPGAKYIGYKNLNDAVLKQVPKDKRIVVYCSIGYRSEKIGEKLKKKGYTRVYNLYGSIFEWANEGYALEDKSGQPTKRVHVYNKQWSKWMTNKNYEKVY